MQKKNIPDKTKLCKQTCSKENKIAIFGELINKMMAKKI